MRRYVMSLRSVAENSHSPDRSTTRLARCPADGDCADAGVEAIATLRPKTNNAARTTRAVTVMVTSQSETGSTRPAAGRHELQVSDTPGSSHRDYSGVNATTPNRDEPWLPSDHWEWVACDSRPTRIETTRGRSSYCTPHSIPESPFSTRLTRTAWTIPRPATTSA